MLIKTMLAEHEERSRWLLGLSCPPPADRYVYKGLQDYMSAMERLHFIEQSLPPDAPERHAIHQYLDTAADIFKSKCEEFGLTPLEIAGFGLDMPDADAGGGDDDGGSGILAPIITGPRDRPTKDAKPFEEVHEEGEDERR